MAEALTRAQINKRYRDRHPDSAKQYYADNRERIRLQQVDSRLRQRYGISKADFDAMLVRQAYCCLVCERRMSKPHVDHDHFTGEVRGLLCLVCNLRLGVIENRLWVDRALDYLKACS